VDRLVVVVVTDALALSATLALLLAGAGLLADRLRAWRGAGAADRPAAPSDRPDGRASIGRP
jgi:hypothetical protein